MIVPYHDHTGGVYSTHTVCYTDTVTTEAVCVDMMPTTQCAYCGLVLLQTMGYGQPMVCEPCYWMSESMDEPVSLDTLVGPSEDYADSRTGSDTGGGDEASSTCDGEQDEPEPEKECEYSACACLDSLTAVRDGAELYRYQWLTNCFMHATTDMFEWKRGHNHQIWVGIDVCPFYMEDVPAQVLVTNKKTS